GAIDIAAAHVLRKLGSGGDSIGTLHPALGGPVLPVLVISERVGRVNDPAACAQESKRHVRVLPGAEDASRAQQRVETAQVQQDRATKSHVAPVPDVPGGRRAIELGSLHRGLETNLATSPRPGFEWQK